MKFVDLKKSLKEKVLPCYIISGDDVFLLYKSLELIENATVPNMPDFNKVIFGEEMNYQAKDIVESLQALPIGDNSRLVVVRDLSIKNTKDNVETLNDYLKNPNPTSCLVLFLTKPNEIALKIKGVEIVDCSRLDEVLVKKLIVQKFAELGKVINQDACALLCDYCLRNMARIYGEIEKLASYVGEEKLITAENVETNVVKELEFQGFEFSQAVAGKNSDKAFNILNVMLNETSSVGIVISSLYNQFSRMFFIRVSKDTDLVIAGALGCKEFAVRKTRELAENFSKRSLKNIVEKISALEFEMKSGKISAENLCERLVFEIINVL